MAPDKTGSMPRSLADRLGVRTGMSVAMIDVTDDGLVHAVRQRVGRLTLVVLPRHGVSTRELPPLIGLGAHRDMIFLQADSAETLAIFPRVVAALRPDGVLWVLCPRGRREVGQSAIIAAGLSSGLADESETNVSERFSALKFVLRQRDRSGRR
jgi:hypothetical protein